MQFTLATALTVLTALSFVTADFRQDSVNLHNQYRARHHSPNIAQSADLDKFAQIWAQNIADSGFFKHSGGKYGENVYMTTSTEVSDSQVVTDAINAWYSDASKYDYSNPGFSMATGSFTQVVWKNSKNVGIGVARSSKGTFVCASYDPAGNVEGQFPQNVSKP